MSKTLVVSYLPRGERSNTKKIVDAAVAALAGTTIETLDLIADTPELFLRDNLMAYIMRNYVGEQKPEYEKALASFDRLVAQIKSADNVIVAYPMYNFSMPAVVKAWFDAVMQKGQTFDVDASGMHGLLTKKNALVITTSGGDYSGNPGWEHATSLGVIEFQFMGFKSIDKVTAAALNAPTTNIDEVVGKAAADAVMIVKKWA